MLVKVKTCLCVNSKTALGHKKLDEKKDMMTE